jgi:hypothetical protein
MIVLDLIFGFLLVFAGKNIFQLCAGSALAMSFEWFMMIIGVGFVGGGYLLMNMFPSSSQQDLYSWLIFVIGGIAGMCLMVITFDLTLIMISSLLGALLIINAFHGGEGIRELLFIGSVFIGIFVQYLTYAKFKSR